MSGEVTQQLARSITMISYDDLSEQVVKKVKLALLDSIGCALGGYVTDRAKIALELVDEFGGNPQASIIGSHHTSYGLAAFANGELINTMDYDCMGPLTPHTVPIVTPPCLAMAERERASGKQLLLALAIALEVGGRAINSLAQEEVWPDRLEKGANSVELSPRFSWASSIFGGVAGAGKLLGLNTEEMSNAFGIAGASVPVPAKQKWDRTSGAAIMTKYNCWVGWIAQLATIAALLAKRGFTGDTTILDGEWGYWKIVGSPFFKEDNLLKELGETWHDKEIRFKLFPVCFLNHSGITAINNIMQENEINPDDVEEVVVKGSPKSLTPNRMGLDLKSSDDMQFCNANVYALAVYHGRSPGPAWQLPPVFNNPRIKALAEKVRVEPHPRSNELIASKIEAGSWTTHFNNVIVEITARGRKFTTELSTPKGSHENPMTETELVDKFRNNVSYSMLKSSKVEGIIQTLNELEKVDDVTKLMRLMTVTT
ncbi:MmgE/PrpD family protein [Chloroflexota bacterium]